MRMLRSLVVLALVGCASAASAQTTVVILARHAEQEAGQDPGLSAAGKARAEALLDAVRDAGIVAVYHTQYRRTRETASVVATALGVPMTELGPKQGESVNEHAAAVAADILAHHRGKVVLVVGHSNTVPLIAAALGAKDAPKIVETEYYHLLTVLKNGDAAAHLIHSRYGS
jgi:broad specificity phosphatase PhoE